MLISFADMATESDLTPEQKADSARLMAKFQQWKADERAKGRRGTQEDIAHALNFSQSAFSQFCRGIRPVNADLLTKLYNLYGWEPSEISPNIAKKMAEFASVAAPEDDGDHAPIKLIDAKASAGTGQIFYSDDVKKMLMFRRDWLAKNDAKPDNVVAFPVDGDSMIDEHIIDGSIVLVDTTKKEPITKKIYVLWMDGQLYVKQLINKDGFWLARSHNASKAKEYPDIQINIDDRIVGRAFWCGFGL